MINSKFRQRLKLIGLSDKETDNIIKNIADDLEKTRLYATLSFLNYTYKIKESSYSFRLLGSLFLLESLIAAKEKNKLKKIQKLSRDNLDFGDKISLLAGFIFSRKYTFRKDEIYPLRHIMFEDFNKDTNFKNKNYITRKIDYCSGSNTPLCYCADWLKESQNRIDTYLDTLIKYFYEMRHAVVHEAFPVFGLPNYSKKYTAGVSHSSLLDAYPISKDKKYFRSYEVYINPDDFFRIMKSCIKNYLIKKYIIKIQK
ncbi:MAG: hypothetical protein ACKKMV_02590 [Candidatus Nealsonbacteria bacterium]